MKDRIRIGVIGVGHLGWRHARVISELREAELAGIYDIHPARAHKVGERLSCRVYPDCNTLIQDVDAVCIAVPTNRHFEVTMQALRAGVHVLVEKPISSDLDQAEEMLRQARKRGVVLQVGHIERFNPAYRIGCRSLGRPLFIESHRLSPFVVRGTEVDVILDLMIHDIDLSLQLMGTEVREIWAAGVPVVTSTVDIANARLTFSGCRTASLTASRISAKRMRKMRIFQQDTYISMDLLERSCTTYRVDRTEGVPELQEQVIEAGEGINPLADEIASFAGSVRMGTPAKVTGDEAVKALQCALRIRECMSVPPMEHRSEKKG